ncbi:RNA-binding transcriptional accessory protein [Arthrobacter zhangbolii]|uniref:RNA-binding transcriptional accessory protein n=1 Tax=Arthrobacter zhangbolii TaxID=2886936 RepID=A0A9X1M9H2_9MICC|nr:Tex family protein [Arthrobacter zhangbolii]MCC3273362.1 RNA-binding transcriptional accessory protein [Arthrobacter zhangbolii]MCC3295984.1 RNA-binding transcriptional accessory protein [Arthrobacter zhangbolii]UON92659.1 RNA-binding transcriptional accessory protein [Arthrobacter zhangbolii]
MSLSAAPAPAPSAPDAEVIAQLAAELGVAPWQVRAAVELLDGGATVPFIARYRKEVTGTLDDAQLRELDERLRYLRELQDRRRVILAAVEAQGKLTPELRAAVLAADTKSRLEDIYLPYRSKRRTKAQTAREAGLEPLADALLADPRRSPEKEAAAYLGDGVPDAAEALAGARAILIERVSQDADLLTEQREKLWRQGRMRSQVRPGKETEGRKFTDYYDFSQSPSGMPSHRVLALFRGEKEGILELSLSEGDPADAEALAKARARYERSVAARLGVADRGRPADAWLAQTVQLAWRRILAKLSVDLRVRLFTDAEAEAVRVFAANLRDVLLAAPAGNRATLGLDPGLRTGVKVAVVDGTGQVVATDTVYPHAPARRWDEALATLAGLVRQHGVELIAIGNGTASRETDKLAAELIRMLPAGTQVRKLVVSEAGASVYSASALASAELPGMDVSLRGAVSIARRLQDPLAELVKIDPKSIGVGQYQHDVTPAKLERSLDAVIEDCVNAVGVDLNTASPALLTRVAGVGPLLSENIVAYRNANGPFTRRRDLVKVPRLGAKAFEQCAGFLRVTGGSEPLDGTSVHPESYPTARKVLAAAGATMSAAGATLDGVDPAAFVDGTVGLPTVLDILAELRKPGRDPRPAFETATFSEGIEKISDLRPGMILDGVVTNVAAFGAFVDVGVHQDGLVHISAMSTSFISDPREVVKSGQVVKVKVLEADPERKRISLTLRLDDDAEGPAGGRPRRLPSPAAPAGSAGTKRSVRQARPEAAKPPAKAGVGKPARGGDSKPAKTGAPSSSASTPAAKAGRGGPQTTVPTGAMADAMRAAGLLK